MLIFGKILSLDNNKFLLLLCLIYLFSCQHSKRESKAITPPISTSNNKPIRLLNEYYSTDSISKFGFNAPFYDDMIESLSSPYEFHLGIEGIIKTVFCGKVLVAVYFYPFNENETDLYISRLQDSLGIKLDLGLPQEHRGKIIVYAQDSSYNKIFEEDNRVLPPFVSWTDKRLIHKCPEVIHMYKPDNYYRYMNKQQIED